jgi:hypothetical protein
VIIMVVWVDNLSTAYYKDCTADYEAFWSKFRAKFQLNEMVSNSMRLFGNGGVAKQRGLYTQFELHQHQLFPYP